MVGRGRLVFLGAVLAGSMLVPAAASAGNVPLIVGTLTGTGGRPVAGVVTLEAWPDPLPDKVGQTFQMLEIARQKVGADGRYRFGAADVALTPQLRRAAAFNNGQINFEMLGDSPDRSGQVDLSRVLSGNSWNADTSAVAVPATHPTTLSDYKASVAAPADPGPSCTFAVVSRKRASTKVGEVHRWVGSTADFYYGKHADSDIGVALSSDGVDHWSLSGHAHIGNSQDSEIHIPLRRGQGTAKYMKTDFIYTKYVKQWNGVGPRCSGYVTRATSWLGGTDYGALSNHWDGRCNQRPSTQRTHYVHGSDFTRNSSRATHYGVSASAFGATLDDTSGYSTSVRFDYHFQNANWICAKTNPFKSQWVAVGPRWSK